jgi:hypothetical protein
MARVDKKDDALPWTQAGNYTQSILRGSTTEYIFYCKRAILFLSSSKILTPHPPLRPPAESLLLPQQRRGVLARGRGGRGVNILEDERNRIALLQYGKIRTLWGLLYKWAQ